MTTVRRRRAVLAVVLATVLVGAAGSTRIRGGELPRAVTIAYEIMLGYPAPDWPGGRVPYSWGGGHASAPGPSTGTCQGYRGSVQPCPAEATVGLDCSGLARWVYRLAFGRDVLGPGNTDDHIRLLRRVPAHLARPGDLVFFGTAKRGRPRTSHVGIFIGGGRMINALRTGTRVRVDRLDAVKGFIGYFRYDGSQ
ncbi:C40 family peptidase [Thermopolyspora sp. NPDC052614]|uniref:C40 family peptidase n=1 Tax=Thermopolyspora sp. NPDC052614 TaxID=3155682 RepID=UPI00342895AA